MENRTLLNPYSVKLEKYPFMNVGQPIYKNGDYSIYKWSTNHYLHTFKNIVISERVTANKALIDNLKVDIKPTTEAALYHDHERLKDAIARGIKAAKKLSFTIE